MLYSIPRNAGADLHTLETYRKFFERKALREGRRKGFSFTGKMSMLGEEITLKEEIPVLSILFLLFLIALVL